jgi:hypothetical protein
MHKPCARQPVYRSKVILDENAVNTLVETVFTRQTISVRAPLYVYAILFTFPYTACALSIIAQCTYILRKNCLAECVLCLYMHGNSTLASLHVQYGAWHIRMSRAYYHRYQLHGSNISQHLLRACRPNGSSYLELDVRVIKETRAEQSMHARWRYVLTNFVRLITVGGSHYP